MQVKEEKRHLNFYEYFLVFFVACFLGVGLEMIYWYIRTGVIESRSGLIYGPFNLVYGIGALLMTIVLLNQKNKVKVFVLGFLIGAIFEFSCSVFQEYVFHTVSWDYGNSFLSLGGRVNLFFSCCWGILAVVWVELVIPLLLKIFANCNSYIIGFEDKQISEFLEENITQMVRIINMSYKISKSSFVWQKKMEEKQKNMKVQLSGVSKAISKYCD